MSTYPEPNEYIRSVKALDKLVHDPVLKRGQPCKTPLGQLWTNSGGFAFVFKIRSDGKMYALRCWTQPPGDAERHYEEVGRFLKSKPLPYFVECAFTAKGIVVNGTYYPIVRMEWLEALSLREFIAEQLVNGSKQPHSGSNDTRIKLTFEQAAQAFLQMSASLHRAGVSHGDLQADNVKVVQKSNGFEFKLIDYDTLCVPEGRGRQICNSGLATYQHPKRSLSAFTTEKDDYFSELVIHLSLRALAPAPELWREFDCERRDKELLFAGDDFRAGSNNLPPPPVFRRLYELGAVDPYIRGLTVVLWNFTRCPDIRLLQPIEEVVKLVESSGGGRDFKDIFKPGHGRMAANGSNPGSWLDDGDFRRASKTTVNTASAFSPPPSTSWPSQSQSNGGSFDDLVGARRGRATNTGKAPAASGGVPPTPANSPQSAPSPSSPPARPAAQPQSSEVWSKVGIAFVTILRWAIILSSIAYGISWCSHH
jgi:serine/threonine protein kinase